MTDTATRDLDTTTVVLDALVAARQTADRAEANLLGLAVHYVDLHPVTPHAPAATWTDRSLEVFPTRTPTGPGATVNEVERARLAGDGTPGIAEYAVEELAAALNVGYHTGLSLVTDAVELCYRLPKLWALVQGTCRPGRPAPWPPKPPPSPQRRPGSSTPTWPPRPGETSSPDPAGSGP